MPIAGCLFSTWILNIEGGPEYCWSALDSLVDYHSHLCCTHLSKDEARYLGQVGLKLYVLAGVGPSSCAVSACRQPLNLSRWDISGCFGTKHFASGILVDNNQRQPDIDWQSVVVGLLVGMNHPSISSVSLGCLWMSGRIPPGNAPGSEAPPRFPLKS